MSVLVVELALAVSFAAAPAPVAILPVVGKAPDDVRHDVDTALRQALLGIDTVDLLSPVETRNQLMSLAEMGMVCLPEDVTCLVKLGLAAEVSFVLVPAATPAKGGVDLEIGVIDVGQSQRARLVKAKLTPSDAAAVDALIRKALDLPEKAGAPDDHHVVDPDEHVEHVDHVDHHVVDENPAVPDKEKPIPLGAVVTGVAGGVGVLALAGALTCDLIYADVVQVADAKTRQNVVQPAGATLWVTTVLAAAGVGAGVYLLVTSPPDTP